jgi:hypothetical protein
MAIGNFMFCSRRVGAFRRIGKHHGSEFARCVSTPSGIAGA